MPHSDHGHARKQRFQERLHVLHDTALHRKLKQHLPAAFNEPWTRRHWIHASLFATIGALAATIVPGFSNSIEPLLPASHATLALPLPPPSAARRSETPGDSWQILRVEPGQTLSNLFETAGVPATVMHRVLERATTRRTVVASGEIRSSLYASATKAGLSPSAINTMTDEIFKYDIDFSKDVQPGDRFSVVMDETWREGERIDTSKILAATFSTGGKTYTGFRYERGGKFEYFDIDGRPLKKSFIRMPIQFARLSSTFGARRHPVLGSMRMHKGVDYAASSGTPIMAAGDSRVEFVG